MRARDESFDAPRRRYLLPRKGSADLRDVVGKREFSYSTASQGEIAHIESPANGMVIAIDPDIPTENQRVPISAKGIKPGMRLKLNGSPLSDGAQALLWAPKTGSYRLALEDERGDIVDQILFTVR